MTVSVRDGPVQLVRSAAPANFIPDSYSVVPGRKGICAPITAAVAVDTFFEVDALAHGVELECFKGEVEFRLFRSGFDVSCEREAAVFHGEVYSAPDAAVGAPGATLHVLFSLGEVRDELAVGSITPRAANVSA